MENYHDDESAMVNEGNNSNNEGNDEFCGEENSATQQEGIHMILNTIMEKGYYEQETLETLLGDEENGEQNLVQLLDEVSSVDDDIREACLLLVPNMFHGFVGESQQRQGQPPGPPGPPGAPPAESPAPPPPQPTQPPQQPTQPPQQPTQPPPQPTQPPQQPTQPLPQPTPPLQPQPTPPTAAALGDMKEQRGATWNKKSEKENRREECEVTPQPSPTSDRGVKRLGSVERRIRAQGGANENKSVKTQEQRYKEIQGAASPQPSPRFKAPLMPSDITNSATDGATSSATDGAGDTKQEQQNIAQEDNSRQSYSDTNTEVCTGKIENPDTTSGNIDIFAGMKIVEEMCQQLHEYGKADEVKSAKEARDLHVHFVETAIGKVRLLKVAYNNLEACREVQRRRSEEQAIIRRQLADAMDRLRGGQRGTSKHDAAMEEEHQQLRKDILELSQAGAARGSSSEAHNMADVANQNTSNNNTQDGKYKPCAATGERTDGGENNMHTSM